MMVDAQELEKAYQQAMQGKECPEMIIWRCSEGCGYYVLPRDKDIVCVHMRKLLYMPEVALSLK